MRIALAQSAPIGYAPYIITRAILVLMSHSFTITAMGARGEGVAEHDGNRVFIPFTLPGETVHAKLNGKRAQLQDVMEASPERQQPICTHFGQCGGCQLQHWDVEKYRQWKTDLLATALGREGIDAKISPLIDASGEGRRRITMHGRAGRAGFMGLRSNEVHEIDFCPILVPALKPAAQITQACAKTVGDCDVSLTHTKTGLDVAIRAKGKPDYQGLSRIARKFKIARLAMNGEVILSHSAPQITMGPAQVSLPSDGFLQATARAEELMGELVTAACKDAKRVADLFCGVGPFALRIAQTAKVFACDNNAAAVTACEAALRGTPGLKVLGTQIRDLMREPLSSDDLKKLDAVIFDPPRAGAEAQASEITQSRVKTVVAISCDPKTFARDARILLNGGYKLESVTTIDQFIWSSHLEVVGVFRR